MAVETVVTPLIILGIFILCGRLHIPGPWILLPKWCLLRWVGNPKTNKGVCESKPLPSNPHKPYQLPILRPRTSSRMAMSLKRLDQSNWLTIDSNYLPEHAIRCRLLELSRPQVLQCLPGTQAACHEVLSLVTTFLSTRFPEFFTLNSSSSPTIHNHVTGETFPIGHKCSNPLETAVRLAMEDFNILFKEPATGEYLLQASATLFPAGWQLQERIGTSMANLHAPVPGWKEKLGSSVNRYFDHLSPKTCMERTSFFIQTSSELFQDGPESPRSSSLTLKAENITIRRERQTFTRLEKSGAVLFTVRTFMQPLLKLERDEIEGLLAQVRGWEKEMKIYKGWDRWGKVMEEWCDETLARGGEEGEIV